MKKAVHSKKVNFKKTMEVNNDLNFKVNEQHDAIIHLKEQCDIVEDQVQKIPAARTPMKKRIGMIL